jgi:hypothetical protein
VLGLASLISAKSEEIALVAHRQHTSQFGLNAALTIHALVRDCHRSREFIEFLKLLDAAYPASTAIKLILDNHSATYRKKPETGSPLVRLAVSTSPSRLRTVSGSISLRASSPSLPGRSFATSGWHRSYELKERIMAGIDDVNRHPVIHTWSYRLTQAA